MLIEIVVTFILSFSACCGTTVHYTNSPMHLLRAHNFTTYKLDVAGSDPITIVEDNRNVRRHPVTTTPSMLSPLSGAAIRRTLKGTRAPTTQFSSSLGVSLERGADDQSADESKRVTTTTTSDSATTKDYPNKTTVFSPALLKKFLNEYAERMHQTDAVSTGSHATNVRNDGGEMSDNNYTDPDDKEDKYGHGWIDKPNRYEPTVGHPFNDRDGWITLDPIPWSTATVSKWHGNKNKFDNVRPVHYAPASSSLSWYDKYDKYNNDEDDYRRPISELPKPKPSFHVDYPPPDDNYSPDTRPNLYASHERPIANSHNYQRPDYDAWPRPSPALPSPSPSHYDYSFQMQKHDNWYENGHNGHNRPPLYTEPPQSQSQFHSQSQSLPAGVARPWPSDIHNYPRAPLLQRRPAAEQPDYEYHRHKFPDSHPASGNGEWVLVSTTKGYQFPRNGQRAFAVKTATPGHTQHTKKSIKLSVQSPSVASSTPSHTNTIQTAHNGLLEVAAPFDQTIEETKAQMVFNKPATVAGGATANVKRKQIVLKSMKSPGHDSAAVLAAVTAGIVPATVAILMPMLGRRRRDVQNVTHFPLADYEDTIPKNLIE